MELPEEIGERIRRALEREVADQREAQVVDPTQSRQIV